MPINHEKAKEYGKSKRFHGINFTGSDVLDFKDGGVGATLYLASLRHYSVLFFVLALITAPIYYYQVNLYTADTEKYSPKHFAYIDLFSYGSIYSQMYASNSNNFASKTTCLSSPGSSEKNCYKINEKFIRYVYFIQPYKFTDYNGYLQIEDIEKYYEDYQTYANYEWINIFVACSVLSSLVFFGCLIRWENITEQIIEIVDVSTLSPVDFSFEIHGLPSNMGDGVLFKYIDDWIRDEELKAFKHDEYDLTNRAHCDKLDINYNIQNQYDHFLHNDAHEGLKLGLTVKRLDNGIYNFMNLTAIAEKIRKRRTVVYLQHKRDINDPNIDTFAQEKASYEGGDYYIKQYFDEYDELSDYIKESRQGLPDYEQMEVLYGIASFDSQELRERMMRKHAEAYKCYYLKYYFCCCCYTFPEYYLLKTPEGKEHHVTLQIPRGEPGDMRWENIYVNPCEKCLRSLFFYLLIAVCLAISLFGLIMASVELDKLPKAIDCGVVNSTYGSSYADKYNASAGYDLYQFNDLFSIDLEVFKVWKAYIEDQSGYTKYGSPFATVNDDKFYNYDLFYCYCSNNFLINETSCKQELNDYAMVTLLPLLLSVGVTVINLFLYYAVLFGVEFKRLSSESLMIADLTFYLALTYFINLALLPILIGGDFKWFLESAGLKIEDGSYLSDFFAKKPVDVNYVWYQLVGYQMVSNIFMNFLIPNISEFFKVISQSCMSKLLICFSCCCFTTQDDLNEQYAGPKLLLYERYSYFLNHISLCFIFAPSMPVLYIIGFAGIYMQYLVDKYSLVYSYRKPESLNSSINATITSMMYWVLLAHLVWAIWIYANPIFFATYTNDFPTGDYVYNQAYLDSLGSGEYPDLSFKQAYINKFFPFGYLNKYLSLDSDEEPYLSYLLYNRVWRTVLFWLVIALVFAVTIVRATCLKLVYLVLYYLCCCCLCKRTKIEDAQEYELEDRYHHIKQVIKSYNILDNPTYANIIKVLREMGGTVDHIEGEDHPNLTDNKNNDNNDNKHKSSTKSYKKDKKDKKDKKSKKRNSSSSD